MTSFKYQAQQLLIKAVSEHQVSKSLRRVTHWVTAHMKPSWWRICNLIIWNKDSVKGGGIWTKYFIDVACC